MAQTAMPDPARRYPLPTYDENWQFLSDLNRHSDPWDIVKYVQLDGRISSLHIYLDPDYAGEDEARFRWGKNRQW